MYGKVSMDLLPNLNITNIEIKMGTLMMILNGGNNCKEGET